MQDPAAGAPAIPANALELATSFVVAVRFIDTARTRSRPEITVERRDGAGQLWAVCWWGQCLASDGSWEAEPMPSNRDDMFVARTRFGLAEAFARARAAIPAVKAEMGPHGAGLVSLLEPADTDETCEDVEA